MKQKKNVSKTASAVKASTEKKPVKLPKAFQVTVKGGGGGRWSG